MKNKIIMAALLACNGLYAGAQGLTIQSGATFKVTGNLAIVVENGNLINNGNGNLSTASIYFKGNTAGSFGGTTPLAIQSLYINKTAGNVLLGNNVAIANQVVLQNGLLDLNGKDINLAPTATITGETEATRITGPLGGTVNITVNLNAPLAQDPANLGAVFTSAEDFGSVVIKRGHKQQLSGTGKSILRYYDITPANNAALGTIFRMRYLDAELDGITESDLRFFKSTNNGVTFTDEGFSSRNTTSNFVNLSNVNSFARLTLTSQALSLPVVLQSFTAQCVNNATAINFKTAQEVNTDKFIVQRSSNNTLFTDIASIAASGGSTGKAYTYTDAAAVGSVNYYRLKMQDKDGSISYSPIQKINACQGKSIAIKLTPIPVKNNAVLTVNAAGTGALVIKVFSADGRQLLKQTAAIAAGINTVNLNLITLNSGSYYLTALFADGTSQRIPFIK